MTKPLLIDLFCGLGGFTEGFLAEGWDVIGFDIEQHAYGDHAYPAQLVLQDVLTLHGSQFRCANLIVASPPCQEYSYMAMPWKLAKAKAAAIRADTSGKALADLNRLFDACFRIQTQASIAAGRHIPMVVENVRGAIPWVSRSRWNFGSFHLWGDVPALMPLTLRASKVPGFRFDGSGKSFQTASVDGVKAGDAGWRETGPGRQLQDRAIKVHGLNWADHGKEGYKPQSFNVTAAQRYRDGLKDGLMNIEAHQCGTKQPISGHAWYRTGHGSQSSKSDSRKAASAMIAKIPLPLSVHLARVFRP